MIIEQHYDDEVLIELLDEAEEDAHVPACDTCSGTLESYRDLSAALHDDSVWDERELPEAPKPETTNFLRAFAERSRAEDIAAGPIVAKLIADPSAIEQHPEWRTAGVVRGLLKHVDSINFTDPKGAVDVATLATKVADSLEVTLYPTETVKKLQATAWREVAYALMTINSYANSIAALDRADELLSVCSVAEYDFGRTRLLRALIYGDVERLDEAISFAKSALTVFVKFGDRERQARAHVIIGGLLMRARQFTEALQIQEAIAADVKADSATRAIALHNCAICLRELSKLDRAKSLFTSAVAQFELLGLVSMRARARWHFARVLLAEGKCGDARALFQELQREFADLGMPHDVALLSVDASEASFMLNDLDEVERVAKSAMEYFVGADLAYTQAALMALSYLKEAAESRTLTHASFGTLRTYFELLPKQPHLLFAFPL